MKKSFWKIAAAAVLAAAFCVSAIGCAPFVEGDTFIGKISEEAYETVETAAQAFVRAELSGGPNADINYVSYTKESDLTDEAVEELDLGELSAEDVTSAEAGTIIYRYVRYGSLSLDYTHTVYILGFEEAAYRYYTPAPQEGEMLTKSYFASLLAAENFENVTMSMKTSTGLNINNTRTQEWMNLSVESEVELSLCDTGFHLKSTVTQILEEHVLEEVGGPEEEEQPNPDEPQEDSGKTETEVTSEIYVSLNDGILSTYVYDGEEWTMEIQSFEGDSIAELMVGFIAQYLSGAGDYAYFVRTESGFELNDELYLDYMESQLSSLIGESSNAFTYEGSAFYTVSGGKFTKEYAHVTVEGTVSGVTTKAHITGYATYKNYGKTSVTVPQSVRNEAMSS